MPLNTDDLNQKADVGSECPRCIQHHADTWHPTTPCHPKLNLCVPSYVKDSGVLKIACFICGTVVAEIVVSK